MKLTQQQWHERFQQQAIWTASLRAFLFSQVKIHSCKNVLEVGSGTAAISQSLHSLTRASLYGLDIDCARTQFARREDPQTNFVSADAFSTPFPSGLFDLTFCHYLLLWLHEPAKAITEMRRITRSGGKVLALAEPDYLARVDAPASLQSLGQLQTRALLHQGARTDAGRNLAGWFLQAGLEDVQYGVSGFQLPAGEIPTWFESEWQMFQSDLGLEHLNAHWLKMKEEDRQAWLSGQRVLWIPTFYAIGTVPG